MNPWYNLVNAVKHTYSLIKPKKALVFIPAFFDLLFVFVYGFLARSIYFKIREYAYALNAAFSQNSGSISMMYSQDGISGLLGSGLQPLAFNMLLLILLLAFSAFFIYALFQGLAWRFSLDLIKKENLNSYLRKFFFVSLFWFAWFCLYYFFNFLFYFLDTLNKRANASPASIITYVFFLLLVYFASISYVLIGYSKKPVSRSFALGLKKAHYIILPFALFVVCLFLLNFLFALIVSFSYLFGIFFGIVFILPLLALGRILLSFTLKDLEK